MRKERFKSIANKTLILLAVLLFGLILEGLAFHQTAEHFLRLYSVVLGACSEVHDVNIESLMPLFSTYSHDKQLEMQGEALLRESGYRNTWRRFILKDVFSHVWLPTGVGILALMIVIVLSFVTFHRKSRKIYDLEVQKRNLVREKDALQSTLQALRTEIENYEGNLYHQLKTSLSGLSLCLERITLPNADVFEIQTDTNIQIERMSRILQVLLRTEMCGSAMEKIQRHPEDINLMLEDAISRVKAFFDKGKIRITFNGTEMEALFPCDAMWMEECFTTLLENAAENALPESEANISLRIENPYYAISISSCPKRMPPNQEKIFERFYSTSGSGHFGIGLHMCKQIIESHHGNISCLFQENQIIFHLLLPIMDARAYDSIT